MPLWIHRGLERLHPIDLFAHALWYVVHARAMSPTSMLGAVGGWLSTTCRSTLPTPHHVVVRAGSGAPGRIRTRDHLIRSQMLCPLSYGRTFHAQIERLTR
jgi:hypothetical protein